MCHSEIPTNFSKVSKFSTHTLQHSLQGMIYGMVFLLSSSMMVIRVVLSGPNSTLESSSVTFRTTVKLSMSSTVLSSSMGMVTLT